MLDGLKITFKQKALLQEIAKSHVYFPELALDDLNFKNSLYVPKDQIVSDLIKQEFIVKKGKSLAFTGSFAKRYWNDVLSMIPVDEKVTPITKEFLDTKTTENLQEVYHTLTSLEGESLTRDDLINEIIKCFNIEGEKKMITKKKTSVKDAAPKAKAEVVENDGRMTPKEIASANNLNPTAVRKAIRSVLGKCKEGNWRLTQEQAEEVMATYEKQRAEASARRSERMKELQAKRKAAAAEAAPKAKKAKKTEE